MMFWLWTLRLELGPLQAEDDHAFEQDWLASSTDAGVYYWTPPVVEIIARKG